MTGAEAVVLGYILAAFVIFGTTLAWVSSDGRRRPSRSAANAETSTQIARRTTSWQPRHL